MIKRWYCTGREVDLERQSKLINQDSNIFVQIDHGYTFSRRSPLSMEKSSYMSLPPPASGFVTHVWPMMGVGLYGSSRCWISSSVSLRSRASVNRALSILHCTRQ